MATVRSSASRRNVKWSITIFGILSFLLIVFVVGRQLDKMAKDKRHDTSTSQYSDFSMSEVPFGPPITKIERSKIMKGYWLNYTSSSDECLVSTHLSLRQSSIQNGQSMNTVWPFPGSDTKFSVEAIKPLKRRVSYYVHFESTIQSDIPLGHYSLQRLAEFKCVGSEESQIASIVEFDLR